MDKFTKGVLSASLAALLTILVTTIFTSYSSIEANKVFISEDAKPLHKLLIESQLETKEDIASIKQNIAIMKKDICFVKEYSRGVAIPDC